MTPERWEQVERLWHAVLARPEPERAAAVAELSAGDETLRREVESLLSNLARASAAGFGALAAGVVEPRDSLLGRRLGPYAVHALLGAGGMGEVYQAHDTTLDREVALKILPDLWLPDPGRRARFDREARLLASLNHPNIGAIYGVHEIDAATSAGPGVKALVLELVEGETLAGHIARHAAPSGSRGLPLASVVAIAAQIAEALEAAHERGIVHRDLKPANIKITPQGRVKVLDFGLAAAVSGIERVPDVQSAPALDDTRAGSLLGTASYMSPEQARGMPVDRRADIWAFGCVLYEMLTGAPAFGGDGIHQVLANVVKTEPDWSALPEDTPAALRLCLRRCLQKDVRQRFHDIADVRLAMEGAFAPPDADQSRDQHIGPPPARAAYAGWVVAALVAMAAIALLPAFRQVETDAPEMRLQMATPPETDALHFAMSPDGRSVVILARYEGEHRLWLRSLQSEEGRPLVSTERASYPFWSPDGRSVAFFADRELRRVDLASGLVRTVARAPDPRAGAWNTDGTIVFGSGTGPLYKVNVDGGAVEEATVLLPGQSNHRRPQFLPDGRRFLLLALGAADVRGVYLGSLDGGPVRRVLEHQTPFAFLPPAHVLFAQQDALWAQRLSADYSQPDGEPVPVAPRIVVARDLTGFAALSSSAVGSLAYRASSGERQIVWLDRTGRQVGALSPPDDAQTGGFRLSPDGRTVAVVRGIRGNTDVWLIDTARGVPRRLTFDPAVDGTPVFSPDGRRITYASDPTSNTWDIYERLADGTGGEMLLFASGENDSLRDWSPDGGYLLYMRQDPRTDFDLWALPLSGDREPIGVAQTPFAENNARFSPDGRWIAFDSTETGRSEIYVQPFPGGGAKVQISIGGGTFPTWPRDAREVFYLAPDNRLMAVPVAQRGSTLEAGTPVGLFTVPIAPLAMYEPSHDGQRFLVSQVVSEPSPITILLNWKPGR